MQHVTLIERYEMTTKSSEEEKEAELKRKAATHDGRIALLEAGFSIVWSPIGNSMTPLVKSKQTCYINPCKIAELHKGDIVFCKVKGCIYLHLVKQVGDDGLPIFRSMLAHNRNNHIA